MKNRFLSAALLLGALAVLGGCKKDPDTQPAATTSTVALEFENVAGAKAVATDNTTVYTTAAGETFTLGTFEYYISNVVFTKTDGSTYAAPGVYHLVNAAKPATTEFTISDVPVGDYSGVKFMVGVDSTATKADQLTMTGDLNPANNMYWTWNTGHIFLKAEGNVTSASNKAFTAHIGGYRKPYNAIVSAAPAFPSGTTLLVRADHAPEIHIAADVLKVFNNSSTFTLSALPIIMDPNANSLKIAQNYGVGTNGAGMFTVEHIHAN